MSRPGLKMSELAERSGVSAGTIKHYLREGLLGDDDAPARTRTRAPSPACPTSDRIARSASSHVRSVDFPPSDSRGRPVRSGS